MSTVQAVAIRPGQVNSAHVAEVPVPSGGTGSTLRRQRERLE